MLIHELTLRGILSFGPDSPPLPLQSLNLLIGPNGSGKSNLIEAIGLLRSAPTKLTAPFRAPGSGTVGDWIWKGDSSGCAIVEAVVEFKSGETPVRHNISFAARAAKFELIGESIAYVPQSPNSVLDRTVLYRNESGSYSLRNLRGLRVIKRSTNLSIDESILSQRKDPDQYPILTHLSEQYSQIRIYREWTFGRSSIFRVPQDASLPSDRLEENFSNLGLFLNQLRRKPAAKRAVLNRLRDLYDGLDDFDVQIEFGTVEVFLTEGDFTIPASRLSDGTMRYLCLLAILCDPNPPPLICLEEPELGLHPDLIPKIADLLKEASKRTQLIVTTHSDILVDAMTETPEVVVVMEKQAGQTIARRLENDAELKSYLQTYRLGELWIRGLIGGTRW